MADWENEIFSWNIYQRPLKRHIVRIMKEGERVQHNPMPQYNTLDKDQ